MDYISNHISWKEFFMFNAILISKRSKDPSTKVGAIIVNDENKILSSGYNGFPNGILDNQLPWSKNSPNPLENKYLYVVHAEKNCILNSIIHNLEGSTMYVTLFPCNECTKIIIQKGIKKIIYLKEPNNFDSDIYTASKKMLKLSEIHTELYTDKSSITLCT